MNVAFVVPFALETSLRFARAAARLPGVRMGVLSQEPLDRIPPELRSRLAGFERVGDALQPEALEHGVRRLAREMGGRVDRLLGVLEQLQVPLALVRERLQIRGMDAQEARNFRDKSCMKQVLREHGLPCARHALASGPEEALRFAKEAGLPLIVKPPAGAGSRNTFRVDETEQLQRYLESAPPSAKDPILLEEFLAGREHSFDSISIGGRHVFHSISVYTPGPLEVMQHAWIQWTVLLPRAIDVPEYADIFRAGRAALDALGMVTGMSHMEWFRRPDGGLAISEVAARPPGAQFTTLISAAHDRDFYSAWAELSIFERFDPPQRKYAAGAAFLRGQGEGRVVAIHGMEALRRELGAVLFEERLPQIGQLPSGSYDGEGWLILRHPETEVVERGLERAVKSVRVELG
jgi:hypothetical protein